MGVRIDISTLAATPKASAQAKQVAGKKDDRQGTEGAGGFSKALAIARPKKKAAVADQPAEIKKAATLAVKGAKKPVKAKGKDDAAVDPTGQVTNDAAPADDGGDSAVVGVGAVDDAIVTDDEGVKAKGPDEGTAQVDPGHAIVDPTAPQVVAQAAVQQQQPVQDAGPVLKKPEQGGEREIKAVESNVLPQVEKEQGDGRPVKRQEGDVRPVGKDDPATNKTAAATRTETKVAVRATQQRDAQEGDQPQDGAEVQGQQTELKAPTPVAAQATQFKELFRDAVDRVTDGDEKVTKAVAPTADAALTVALNDGGTNKTAEAKLQQPVQDVPVPVTPEARFAELNHPKVVTAVKTQLLPGGGALQLRMDPPDMGPLRLEVKMENGEMSASFVTANEQATSLLTHSLGQLKHALEGAGISVDKLQVRQGSAESFSENADARQQQGAPDGSSARQEQQRREMLNRMWQKVAGGDPLDLVA